MANCVNISHPDFKKLQKEIISLGIPEQGVNAEQSLKMEGRPTSEYQKEIQRKRMSGIENPMNNLECVEKISEEYGNKIRILSPVNFEYERGKYGRS